MAKAKLSELVLDFLIYPRHKIDAYHVNSMVQSLEAGHTLPPILCDHATKRVVDGFHRWNAQAKHFGPDHEVEVIWKDYKDELTLRLDAAGLNATHGRSLATYDKVHCISMLEEVGATIEQIGMCLKLTTERIGELREERLGKLGTRTVIPLKRTIGHMAGKRLTTKQQEAQIKLSGMSQAFYANQLIVLLESDLFDWENAELIARMDALIALWSEKSNGRQEAM